MTTSATDSNPQAAGGHYVHRLVRHLDLFSGIGGFALAAQWVGGIKTIAFSEIDTYANSILKRHWPDVPNLGDIRNVRGIKCDLITGGFPCQPWSNAGKRAGTNDDRHLWPEMLRVISDSRPTWVLGENVAGLASMALDSVLSDLEAQGYTATTLSIPAVALNGRQVRHRLWIIAHAGRQHGDGRPNLRSACEQLWPMHSDGPQAQPDLCGWLQAAWNTDDLRSRGNRDGLSSGMDRTSRLKSIGNAIVPNVAAEVLRCMMRVHCLANVQDQP